MEWTPDSSNQDIEDRRDSSGGGGGFGGPGLGGFGFGHLGIGGILIVGLLSLLFHQNFFALLSGGGGQSASYQTQPQYAPNPQQDQAEERDAGLIRRVYHDIESKWATILPQQARVPYRNPKLVLYREMTDSGCGAAQKATGPFYCPEDEKIYLDLSFFDELKTRFGGSNGDFAQSYVIAHEFGHHIQKVLGTEEKVTMAQERNPAQKNTLSVDLELQADCYAGVWGYAARDTFKLSQQDMADALSAAAAVGDDHLQKMATGRVSPESWTHGSSAAREKWFSTGYSTGQIAACNTFAGQ